jgi:two-component system cell cycle response regulator CtrA
LWAIQTLTSAQFVVDTVDTGNGALDLIKHYEYDALLTNFTLPDMDACELLRRLRRAGIDMPVLVLSGLSNTTGRVEAFDHGADDVVSMPVESAELVARVQAVVRRANGHSHSILQIGALELDLVSHSLLVHGRPVRLTGKEFALLTLLMQRRDRIISKESFLSHLYGGLEEPDIKIIDVFICKVRRKLAEAGADNVIDTIWGCGYTLRDGGSINHIHSDGPGIAHRHELLRTQAA